MGEFLSLSAHALSADHFRQHRVWRFITPGESSDPDADESHVLPQTLGPAVGDCASYLVSATFTLRNQQVLPGFVEVGVPGQQLEFTPGAVFAGGKTVEALGKDTAIRLERILKTKDAQPVSWELDVCLAGEARRRKGDIARPGPAQAFALLLQLGRLGRMRQK